MAATARRPAKHGRLFRWLGNGLIVVGLLVALGGGAFQLYTNREQGRQEQLVQDDLSGREAQEQARAAERKARLDRLRSEGAVAVGENGTAAATPTIATANTPDPISAATAPEAVSAAGASNVTASNAPAPPPLRLPKASRLLIPRIGVKAPTIEVGLDQQGVMQVPEKPFDVGWYSFTPHPGEPGNAVVAGHVTWVTTGRAVFYRLNELRPGDEIVAVNEEGEEFHYVVEQSTLVPDGPKVIEAVVAQYSEPVLTLITCEGSFDWRTQNYAARRIVRAKLAR